MAELDIVGKKLDVLIELFKRNANASTNFSKKLEETAKEAEKATGKFDQLSNSLSKFSNLSKSLASFAGLNISLKSQTDLLTKYNRSLYDLSRTTKMVGSDFASMQKRVDEVSNATLMSKSQVVDFFSAIQSGSVGIRMSGDAMAKYAKVLYTEYGGAIDQITRHNQTMLSLQRKNVHVFKDMASGMGAKEFQSYLTFMEDVAGASEEEIQVLMRQRSAYQGQGQQLSENEKKLRALSDQSAQTAKSTENTMINMAQSVEGAITKINEAISKMTAVLENNSSGWGGWAMSLSGTMLPAALALKDAFGEIAGSAKGLFPSLGKGKTPPLPGGGGKRGKVKGGSKAGNLLSGVMNAASIAGATPVYIVGIASGVSLGGRGGGILDTAMDVADAADTAKDVAKKGKGGKLSRVARSAKVSMRRLNRPGSIGRAGSGILRAGGRALGWMSNVAGSAWKAGGRALGWMDNVAGSAFKTGSKVLSGIGRAGGTALTGVLGQKLGAQAIQGLTKMAGPQGALALAAYGGIRTAVDTKYREDNLKEMKNTGLAGRAFGTAIDPIAWGQNIVGSGFVAKDIYSAKRASGFESKLMSGKDQNFAEAIKKSNQDFINANIEAEEKRKKKKEQEPKPIDLTKIAGTATEAAAKAAAGSAAEKAAIAASESAVPAATTEAAKAAAPIAVQEAAKNFPATPAVQGVPPPKVGEAMIQGPYANTRGSNIEGAGFMTGVGGALFDVADTATIGAAGWLFGDSEETKKQKKEKKAKEAAEWREKLGAAQLSSGELKGGGGKLAYAQGVGAKYDEKGVNVAEEDEKIAQKKAAYRQLVAERQAEQLVQQQNIALADTEIAMAQKYSGSVADTKKAMDDKINALTKSLKAQEKILAAARIQKKEALEEAEVRLKGATTDDEREAAQRSINNAIATENQVIKQTQEIRTAIKEAEQQRYNAYAPLIAQKDAELGILEAQYSIQQNLYTGLGPQLQAMSAIAEKLDEQLEIQQRIKAEAAAEIAKGNDKYANTMKLYEAEQKILGITQKKLDMTKTMREGYLDAMSAFTNVEGTFTKVISSRERGMGEMMRSIGLEGSFRYGGAGGLDEAALKFQTGSGTVSGASQEKWDELFKIRGGGAQTINDMAKKAKVTAAAAIQSAPEGAREAILSGADQSSASQETLNRMKAGVDSKSSITTPMSSGKPEGGATLQPSDPVSMLQKLHADLPNIISQGIDGSSMMQLKTTPEQQRMTSTGVLPPQIAKDQLAKQTEIAKSSEKTATSTESLTKSNRSISTETKMATGGFVPGSGNEDTVPAMLMPGEFVVRKDAVKKYGPLLNDINAKRFALGGIVGPSASTARGGGGFNVAPNFNMNIRGDTAHKILKSVNNEVAGVINKMFALPGTTGRTYNESI